MRFVCSIALIAMTFCQAMVGPVRADEQPKSYDVIVYGATPAGVAAAIAAARQGKSTALLEPMNIVGGMMSSGLSFSDSNQCDRRTLGGLFEEFHRRIEKEYTSRGVKLDYTVANKDNSKWTYEPKVAEQVFNDMLKEAGVAVFLENPIVELTHDNAKILSIKTSKGEYAGKVFIDTSYEGDLMPFANVRYALGREGKEKYGESLAGQRFPKKPVKANAWDGSQVLPLITGPDGGSEDGDGKIMTYSFRIILTRDPANRIPIEKPTSYDPARFELVRRSLATNPNVAGIDLYPIPGNKVDANNGIGRLISSGLVGASWAYPDAKPAEREKIWQAHKDFSLELLWFLQNDPSVPESVRKTYEGYGLAKDEFEKFGHFPPVMYIREARRMVGEQVITQADIRDLVTKPDSIGIGSFPIDSHDCQRFPLSKEEWTDEGTIFPVHMKGVRYGQPHQLPYKSILPKREEASNLLVPVCLSASHVALSSVRVEPTWIVLGESAGIAAALAVDDKVAVQDVPIEKLQDTLRKAGQIIDLRPEHIEAAKAGGVKERGQ